MVPQPVDNRESISSSIQASSKNSHKKRSCTGCFGWGPFETNESVPTIQNGGANTQSANRDPLDFFWGPAHNERTFNYFLEEAGLVAYRGL